MGMRSLNGLPQNMTVRRRKDKTHYYFLMKQVDGTRKEIPLGEDQKHALHQHKNLIKIAHSQQQKDLTYTRKNIPWLAAELFKRYKISSKKRGIEFCLTQEDITSILERARGKCELTGIPFSFEAHDDTNIRVWSPSIDRIDSKFGYVSDNVRLVCSVVNIAMNQFGEDVLLKIAKGIIHRKLGVKI